VYLHSLGPTLGTVCGVEQAAVTAEGYRPSADQLLSPRGIALLVSAVGVVMAYTSIQLRPPLFDGVRLYRWHLSGATPRAYWHDE